MLGKGKLGTPVYWESVSIKEDNLNELYESNDGIDKVKRHTEIGWVRAYPNGTRFDSSNYNPFPAVEMRVQIIALNSQVGDVPYQIMHRFFMRGCKNIIGYR